MPELPEVQTICDGLSAFVRHKTIASVLVRQAALRWPVATDLGEKLSGQTVLCVERRAKYILVSLTQDLTLILHLGMSGRLLFYAKPELQKAPGPHDHVVFHLEDGGLVVLSDPRRFSVVLLCATARCFQHPLLAKLGVEPLTEKLSPAWLGAALAKKRVPIKVALLDQRLVVGIGNIYASETLHRARILPDRPAHSLSLAEITRLCQSLRAVLKRALSHGGSTLRDYVQPTGERGGFQHLFQVYDRAEQPCFRRGCKGLVVRQVQAGRSTFFCPVCQT